MNRRLGMLGASCSLLIATICAPCNGETNEPVETSVTESAAIERARKCLDVGRDAEITAEKLESPGKLVPFVLTGAPVWKVHFENVKLVIREGKRARPRGHAS